MVILYFVDFISSNDKNYAYFLFLQLWLLTLLFFSSPYNFTMTYENIL